MGTLLFMMSIGVITLDFFYWTDKKRKSDEIKG